MILRSLVWLGLVGIAGCGDDAARSPTRISLDPSSPRVAAGLSVDIAASYVAADQTRTAATDVAWSVDDSAVARVTPGTGGRAQLVGVATGTTMLSLTGRGVTETFPVTVTPAVLKTIGITPPMLSIAAGTTLQLTATGTFSDMTTKNLSERVTWASSATGTATVDNKGVLHGVAMGEARITASLDGVSSMVNATVSPAVVRTIQVTPIDRSFPAGVTQQFTATGVFTDDSHQDLTTQVTWSSDAPAHATISASGLFTAVAVGSATITATKGAVSGSSRVEVTDEELQSIAIDPPAPRVARGLTQQLTATGTYTTGRTQDLTDQAMWMSATDTVATVTATGLATALVVGTTRITATKDGVTGSTMFEVTPAEVRQIHITPVEPRIAAGTTQQFTATAMLSDGSDTDVTGQVTWASSDGDVAAISNDDATHGLATGKIAGATTISATFVQPSGNVTATTELTVGDPELVSIQLTPVNPSLAKGLTVDFVATGSYTDGSDQVLTTQVTWESSDPDVAGISNATGSEGQARALTEGETTIRATFVRASGNVMGTTRLTVTPAELIRIDVTPDDASLPIGHKLPFKATALFTDTSTDVTTQVTWQSSDPALASISNAEDTRGLATGVAIGTVTISATFVQSSGNETGTTTLTVTDAVVDSIAIEPVDSSLPKGLRLQYTATARLSDTQTRDVTAEVVWASANDAVAQISNGDDKGRATAIDLGTTAISATFVQPSGAVTGTTGLQVTNAVLVAITVSPQVGHVAVGGTRQFTASGMFSDGETQDGLEVSWRSRDLTVAEIDPITGIATGVALGSAPIVATSGSVRGDATLLVEAPPRVVVLSPSGPFSAPPLPQISAFFNRAMAPSTLTAQPVSGPCSGTLQLSQDNFATCIGLDVVAMSGGDTIATTTPVFPLDAATEHKIRVLGSVTSAGGVPMGADVTQQSSWITEGSICTPGLVISQVYGGGGRDGAPLGNAFIELHNRSGQPISLGGFAVQYASAAGDSWQTQPLPQVSIPAGGYFLIREVGDSPLPFPTADFTPANPFVMDPAAGKVALTSVPAAMTDACPVGFTHVVDFVGYGSGLSCFEGTAGTATPGIATAVLRFNNGCVDRNNNGADFTVGSPAPRGTAIASSTHICSCL